VMVVLGKVNGIKIRKIKWNDRKGEYRMK
jgi:hypothetical protein